MIRTRLRSPLANSLVVGVAVQGLNAASGVLLARALGPHDRGIVAAVILWPALVVTVGYFGISESLTYYAARGVEPGRLIGTAVALCVAQSVVLTAVAAGVVLFALRHDGSHAVVLGLRYLVYVPLFLVGDYAIRTLQGLARFGIFNILRLLVPAVTTAGIVILYVAGRVSEGTAIIPSLCSYALLAGIGAAALAKRPRSRVEWDAGLARSAVMYAARSHIANLASLANQRLDQVVIALFLTPAQLGLYVVAVTLTSGAPIIAASIAAIVLPTVASLANPVDRRVAASRYVRLTVVGTLVVTVPLLVLAPRVIALFFGHGFVAVANVNRILLVGAAFLALGQTLRALLLALGRPLDVGKAELLALLVTLPGLAALLPLLALEGAAITSVVAYAVSVSWSIRRVAIALGVTPFEILVPRHKAVPASARVPAQ